MYTEESTLIHVEKEVINTYCNLSTLFYSICIYLYYPNIKLSSCLDVENALQILVLFYWNVHSNLSSHHLPLLSLCICLKDIILAGWNGLWIVLLSNPHIPVMLNQDTIYLSFEYHNNIWYFWWILDFHGSKGLGNSKLIRSVENVPCLLLSCSVCKIQVVPDSCQCLLCKVNKQDQTVILIRFN